MIKVAGYCRVSTDQQDQRNSFASQQQYFREYIAGHPDWELFRIYADEGITGTSTKRRAQFNQMIEDACAGKFSLILTKEVSRFSRNILDTISYTRKLKAMGVGVLFLTDGINTMEPEAEMLLSFLASLAQEESRRTSSRVVWGQTRQMERGIVFGPSLLGYTVKNGRMTINPEEAEVVRFIFHKYAVERKSAGKIAGYLTENGYKTLRGGEQWQANTIIKILKNEKYVGDLVQKKSYTPDYLTHEKKRNTGQVPLIILHNHHEPIVRRDLWNLAAERMKSRNKHRKSDLGQSDQYPLSGKIKCGECGSVFAGRFRYLRNREKVRFWRCARATAQGASACGIGKLLRDDVAIQMVHTSLDYLGLDAKNLCSGLAELAAEAIDHHSSDAMEDVHRLESRLATLEKKKEAMLDCCFAGKISQEEMISMRRSYDSQISEIQSRMNDLKSEEKSGRDMQAEVWEILMGLLEGREENKAFIRYILQDITVFREGRAEVRLAHLSTVFHFQIQRNAAKQ